MKKILVFVWLIVLSSAGVAQQFSLFNQQYENPFLINPAYAGTDSMPVAHLHYRSQWAGFEGHPETMIATFHMPLELKNSATGGMILRDRTGILTQTGVRAAYAYSARFNQKASLNLGLSAGVIVNNIEIGDLPLADQDDPLLSQVDGKAEFDANFGAVFRYEAFEAAFSTLYLFDDIRGSSENNFTTRAFSHSTLITSYRIAASDKLNIRPILTYRFATVSPGQLDAILEAEWNNQFKLAMGYRTDFGLVVSAGAEISQRFYIGYGYEYGTSGFGPYARNSHEVMLRVRFGEKTPAKPVEPTEPPPAQQKTSDTDAPKEASPTTEAPEPGIAEDAYNALNVPEEAYRATYEGKGYVLNSINYANNATEIPSEGLAELEKVIGFMLRYPKVELEIGAFTSNQGDANVNILLSRKRAQTIVDYMAEKGVNPARLKAVGYGPQNPIRDNSTREGRALNQRIEIKVLGGLE